METGQQNMGKRERRVYPSDPINLLYILAIQMSLPPKNLTPEQKLQIADKIEKSPVQDYFHPVNSLGEIHWEKLLLTKNL